jgi:hypothetical protein
MKIVVYLSEDTVQQVGEHLIKEYGYRGGRMRSKWVEELILREIERKKKEKV